MREKPQSAEGRWQGLDGPVSGRVGWAGSPKRVHGAPKKFIELPPLIPEVIGLEGPHEVSGPVLDRVAEEKQGVLFGEEMEG